MDEAIVVLSTADWRIEAMVTDENGTPVDLTGSTMRASIGLVPGNILIATIGTSDGSLAVDNPEGGLITFKVDRDVRAPINIQKRTYAAVDLIRVANAGTQDEYVEWVGSFQIAIEPGVVSWP